MADNGGIYNGIGLLEQVACNHRGTEADQSPQGFFGDQIVIGNAHAFFPAFLRLQVPANSQAQFSRRLCGTWQAESKGATARTACSSRVRSTR